MLFTHRDTMEKLTSDQIFKMNGLKLLDAVEDNLDSASIWNILSNSSSECHGVAFRHYTGTKAWKAQGVLF